MTLRSASAGSSCIVPLDYEIAHEQASALGRMGRALETALVVLGEYDRNPATQGAARTKLVQDASDALWCIVVQRESCGLRDPSPVIREYRIPAEVQNRMENLRRPASQPAGLRPRRRARAAASASARWPVWSL